MTTASSSQVKSSSSQRMPIIFLAHGAPPLLDDAAWMSELASWAKRMPRPQSILMLSAHWDATPTKIGATSANVPLVYDFYGFPQRYYEIQYRTPAAAALAARVRSLLTAKSFAHVDEPSRGLDHGAFVPLVAMYPDATVPVLQVSLPGLAPAQLAAFGRAVAPLADEGVLIIGSGFLTHNLRTMGQKTPAWAVEFDQWSADALLKRDVDALIDFKSKSPPGTAQLAHPSIEHFAPVIVSTAAAVERDRKQVSFPITGFWNEMSFSRRSVEMI